MEKEIILKKIINGTLTIFKQLDIIAPYVNIIGHALVSQLYENTYDIAINVMWGTLDIEMIKDGFFEKL